MSGISIPTFALSELLDASRGDDFQSCLSDTGVFYLTNHGVSETSHRSAVDAAMDFFLNGTEDEKEAVTNRVRTARRGYSFLEAESTAQVTNTGEYSDYSMAYSMGLGGNLFSSQQMEGAFVSYFDGMYAVARATARAVLKASRANCDGGIDAFVECDPLFRLRYFPEVPQSRCAEIEPLRMAPHYDLSIITLIQQTPCPNGFVSLQCDVDGTPVALPPRPDAMIVFCGAVATIVSEGRVKAPLHQVVSPTRELRKGSGRTSSVFFLRPRADFRFSVPRAKGYGLDVSLKGPMATFNEWIGGNYETMLTATAAAV